MSLIVPKFSEVKVYAERPAKCPSCGGEKLRVGGAGCAKSGLPMQMKVRSPTPSGVTNPKPGCKPGCCSPGRVYAKSIVAIRMAWAFWFPGKFANQF